MDTRMALWAIEQQRELDAGHMERRTMLKAQQRERSRRRFDLAELMSPRGRDSGIRSVPTRAAMGGQMPDDRAGADGRQRGALSVARLSADELNARSLTTLPGLVGVQISDSRPGVVESRLDVRSDLLAPNGFLHAATVIALADTSCGYGSAANLPDGAVGFTTIELKTNFLGTVTEGGIRCVARLAHGGRSTQVWDAEVTSEATGAAIALFRCTQMVLYPRA